MYVTTVYLLYYTINAYSIQIEWKEEENKEKQTRLGRKKKDRLC